MTYSLLLILLTTLLTNFTLAQGDYPCTSNDDCVDWAADPGSKISANSQCVVDPVDSSSSYCGYVGASCSDASDCDFGSCQDGVCRGYYGETCSDLFSCLAYLQCGSDGTCGGTGALAVYEEQSCTSGALDSEGNCAAPPTDGMSQGSPCGSDDVCSSGECTNFVCEAASANPSQRARVRRTKIDYQSALFNIPINTYSYNRCGSGLVACPRYGVAGHSTGAKKNRKTAGWSPTLSYQCMDTMRNVESCGGCPGSSLAVDCTEIPYVDAVLCSQGECLVQSCYGGRQVSSDGRSCV